MQYADQVNQEFDQGPGLGDYIAIAKRRFHLIAFTAGAIATVAIALALYLPARYQSQALILIEEQEVPRDFVMSTITNYADQQIQVINRRLMTVETVSGIADKFSLYRDEEGNPLPSTIMVQSFAKDMSMNLVSAEVVDPRSGRPGEATIAFTLSYESPDPSTAQKVTNELVTLFLDENLRNRSTRAASTSEFLAREAEALQSELIEIEANLAAFKEANEGSLPELYQFNHAKVERTERELIETTLRLQELGKREVELAAELAQVSPTTAKVTASGEVILGDVEQLAVLEAQRRQLAGRYHETHPDILAIDREIAEVKTRVNTPGLLNASQRDNPAYVLLETQLDSLQLEKASLLVRQSELRDLVAEYEAAIQRAPQVEKEYQTLLRDQQTATQKYNDLKAKQLEAELAQSLEENRKGQRFELVEPPSLPLEPIKPNRKAIALVGLMLALGAGAGAAFLRETMDRAVYGERALEKLTGGPLLGVVPWLETQADRKEVRGRWVKYFVMGVGVVIAVMLLIHFTVKPLDVLFFSLQNRFLG